MPFPKCVGWNSIFKIYRFSKSAVFQNLPAKNVPSSCERRPIRRIFHRVQNVPASCERRLITSTRQSRGLYYEEREESEPPPKSPLGSAT